MSEPVQPIELQLNGKKITAATMPYIKAHILADHLTLLDRLSEKLLPLVLNEQPDLWALDRLILILEHKARVLGLYSAEKTAE